jgi:hypothetical protein
MNMKASSILLHGTKTVCFGTDYLELFSSYLEGNMDILCICHCHPLVVRLSTCCAFMYMHILP